MNRTHDQFTEFYLNKDKDNKNLNKLIGVIIVDEDDKYQLDISLLLNEYPNLFIYTLSKLFQEFHKDKDG